MIMESVQNIAFNIFSSRIWIVLYKMLTITGTFKKKPNQLTIYVKLYRK